MGWNPHLCIPLISHTDRQKQDTQGAIYIHTYKYIFALPALGAVLHLMNNFLIQMFLSVVFNVFNVQKLLACHKFAD